MIHWSNHHHYLRWCILVSATNFANFHPSYITSLVGPQLNKTTFWEPNSIYSQEFLVHISIFSLYPDEFPWNLSPQTLNSSWTRREPLVFHTIFWFQDSVRCFRWLDEIVYILKLIVWNVNMIFMTTWWRGSTVMMNPTHTNVCVCQEKLITWKIEEKPERVCSGHF